MSFGKIVMLSMLAAFSGGAGYSYLTGMQPTPAATAAQPVAFRPYSMCSGSVRVHCVVDGDTIWHEGVKIRVADIDTPEVGEPKCASEAALGAKATKRMLQLVNAGPFQMQAWPGRDEDKYGRKLRVLVRDDRSLGDILVSEGLARTWTGRRQPWC
ncbi:thermonuclease family protein [Agrobacterium sp. LAD9]|uniref:thermonuclease family protein n=1 Tax=Agrobacterium sp. LAD9 TaxID=2055153 RepID=UPI000D1E82E2|nr:thermonuclease family protein [Agrobacterium sp. LAD9]